jgi:hypothetical protein
MGETGTRANASTIFEEKPVTGIGIGVDALPESIRNVIY